MTGAANPAARRGVGVALLALGALALVETLRINDTWSGARLLPLVVTAALLGLAAAHLLGGSPAGAPSPAPAAEPRHLGSGAAVVGALAAYVALLPALGFLLGTAALILALTRLLGHYAWPRALAMAAGLALAAHVVFVVWLGMPLPRGLLGL
jgi:Tripartite tricarboxylate transporter TctB family